MSTEAGHCRRQSAIRTIEKCTNINNPVSVPVVSILLKVATNHLGVNPSRRRVQFRLWSGRNPKRKSNGRRRGIGNIVT